MPELTVVLAKFAETTFVVRAHLLFLGGSWLWFFWVSIDALRVLLMAVPVLLEELADGDLVLLVHVEVFAGVALPTLLLQPVNTYLLLEFSLIRLRDERRDERLELVQRRCRSRLLHVCC